MVSNDKSKVLKIKKMKNYLREVNCIKMKIKK